MIDLPYTLRVKGYRGIRGCFVRPSYLERERDAEYEVDLHFIGTLEVDTFVPRITLQFLRSWHTQTHESFVQ